METANWLYKLVIGSLLGILIGGSSTFLAGLDKPTRKEVSAMIIKEAPVTMYDTLKTIEIKQAEMGRDIKNI